MPSILASYEYDIFISYRQKDNRSDQWVTQFVQALKEELDATFKEDISVYFDENPHDGLHDTHDVDDSLKEKVKCLIFIPIVSRTYCDPKSFAWQKEFLPFLEFAKNDQYGLKIKLPNGNVTSRVLPIRIHDLDKEDVMLFEKETGSVIRSIDFVYSSVGVNRSLLPSDKKEDNLEKNHYRDQINKVGNAIREVISAMKKPAYQNKEYTEEERDTYSSYSQKERKKLFPAWGIIVTAIIILSGVLYFFLPMFQSDKSVEIEESLTKSIAVIPFEDISENHDQGHISDGVMIEILEHMYKIKDLRIMPRSSTLKFKNSNKSAGEIANELGVAYLMEGSVRKAGNQFKISVQLIDGKDESILWQESYEREIVDIFEVQSDIAQQIANSLKVEISPEVKERIESIPTSSLKAYELYLKGRDQTTLFWEKFDINYVNNSITYYNQAIALDPEFSYAYTGLGQSYWMMAHFSPNYNPLDPSFWELSKKYLEKAILLNPNNGWAYSEQGVVQHNWNWDQQSSLKSFLKAVELSPGNYNVRNHLRYFYTFTGYCGKAEDQLNHINSITKQKHLPEADLDLLLCQNKLKDILKLTANNNLRILFFQEKYPQYIQAYHAQFDRPPDFLFYKSMLGEAYVLSGDTTLAYQLIDDLNELSKKRYVSKCVIAPVYMALGEVEKAFELYEQALNEHDNMVHMIKFWSVTIYKMQDDPRIVSLLARSWIPRVEPTSVQE